MARTTPITRRTALRAGTAAGLFGLGTGVGTARSDRSGSTDRCYYQVDFVAGEPIETLGERPDDFYGRQNRLVQYVHADGDEVVERDTWINSLDPEIRECVSAEPIEVGSDAASVRFRVEEGCERAFSLAAYRLPDGEFSFETRQRLVAADSGTFGPGSHELTVEDISRTVCGRHADGEGYIVGARTTAARERARERAEEVRRVVDFEQPDRRHAVVGAFSAGGLDALRRRSDVAYVEPNGTYEAVEQTLPWGIDRVDADVAHDNGRTGAGASIAVVDTGIDSNHPDLSVAGGAAFGTRCRASGRTCRRRWDDDNGHGTHCAGIASARNDTSGVVGVSTRTPLYAVKVLDSSGTGLWGAIANGINWAANNGIDVANLSLGGGFSYTVQWACADAYERGVLLVAAAGNDGGRVSYPARHRSVMAVSATSTDGTDTLAGFSNRGEAVELAAPGRGIYSTVPGGYGTKSGTSMACPHVSGAAAQVLAHADGVTGNRRARRRLRSTAEDLGSPGRDRRFGYGLVDVASALDLDSSEDIGG